PPPPTTSRPPSRRGSGRSPSSRNTWPEMRLELRWSEVKELLAGSATRLVGSRLEVDLNALRAQLAADARLGEIRLDLVHPGERCRIGRVFDVIAPRARLDRADFPGVPGAAA